MQIVNAITNNPNARPRMNGVVVIGGATGVADGNDSVGTSAFVATVILKSLQSA